MLIGELFFPKEESLYSSITKAMIFYGKIIFKCKMLKFRQSIQDNEGDLRKNLVF